MSGSSNAEKPVSDTERDAAIVHFRDLVAADRLSLERFTELADSIVAVNDRDEFAAVLQRAPAPVRFTPPERRMTEPLKLKVNTGKVNMDGRWQVGAHTQVIVNTGGIKLDFSRAEFDAPVIDLDLRVDAGGIDLFIPHGVAVQIVEAGAMRNELGDDEPLPGAPMLRIRARVITGSVKLRRPPVPKVKRRRWWRRRRGAPATSLQ